MASLVRAVDGSIDAVSCAEVLWLAGIRHNEVTISLETVIVSSGADISVALEDLVSGMVLFVPDASVIGNVEISVGGGVVTLHEVRGDLSKHLCK